MEKLKKYALIFFGGVVFYFVVSIILQLFFR